MAPERTLIAWVMGGLGNQMFQYAAARVLAERCGARLELDLSHFDRYPLRRFGLDAFAVPVARWNGRSPAHGGWGRVARAWQRRADRGWLPSPDPRILLERGFTWQELPETGWRRAYLFGFWQSPRYLAGAEAAVRAWFDPARFADDGLRPPLAGIAGEDSVSVHVRRGDYASEPATLAFHGLCGEDYYRRACGLLRRAVPGCRFHVFSDEPAAAAALFAGQDDVTVHPPRRQEQDLLLMSRCRHHILANSSFSWWGAWLDGRAGGLTVAPRRWFSREQLLIQNTIDLFPESWILV